MFISNTTTLNGPLFGYHPEDRTPKRYNFRGMRGWFTVPLGWFVRYVNSQPQASPNSDFSTPLYMCETHDDGTLVFQDEAGTSHRDIGTNGIPVPGW